MGTSIQDFDLQVVCVDVEGLVIDPKSFGLTIDLLRSLLDRTFSALRRESSPNDADDEQEPFVTEVHFPPNGDNSASVRCFGLNLGQMQEVRNWVLSGEFDQMLGKLLGRDSPFRLVANRTACAEQYEMSMVSLDTLTDHQRDKLAECASNVHLMAPAGAGKTFVALHLALQTLHIQDDAAVLFVARNEALSIFAGTWVAKRVHTRKKRSQLLARLHLLHEPFEDGAKFVKIRNNKAVLLPLPKLDFAQTKSNTKLRYSVVIVDEAHHVYSIPSLRAIVESSVSEGYTQRMLLSDVSQSRGRRVQYPAEMREVVMSEVVRCSKRIVAGAMAFQLGGEEKLLTKCHHEATGPPLKSFLFDMCAPSTGAAKKPRTSKVNFSTYADHSTRALLDVMTTFRGLMLHNRLAFIVPDLEFREGLQGELAAFLAEKIPDRCFKFVDAATAASDLGFLHHRDDSPEGVESESATCDDESLQDSKEEWLILDTVNAMDGLERLIVIAVGLDSVISDGSAKEQTEIGADGTETRTLETRSMLYRALTRAHLLFSVVNHFIHGGWLEFLGSVRFREEEAFDAGAAMQRAEAQAVEGVVKEKLSGLVSDAAQSHTGIPLDADTLSVLTKDVAARVEQGMNEEAAVNRVMQSWVWEEKCATEALENAMRQAGRPDLIGNPGVSTIIRQLTLSLHQGNETSLQVAATSAITKYIAELLGRQVKEALDNAARARGKSAYTGDIGKVLQQRVKSAVFEGGDLLRVTENVLEDWLPVEAAIDLAIEDEISRRLPENGAGLVDADKLKMQQKAAELVCSGEEVGQAVRAAVRMFCRDREGEKLGLDIRNEINQLLTDPICVCRPTVTAQVCGLKKAPELNGSLGELEYFCPNSLRWKMRIVGKTNAIGVKCANLVLISAPSEIGEWNISIEDALPLLKRIVVRFCEMDMEPADAVREAVRKHVDVQEQAASALQHEATLQQLSLDGPSTRRLSQQVVERLGKFGNPSREDDLEEENDVFGDNGLTMALAVTQALEDWATTERIGQELIAQIQSALETSAKVHRVLVSDAAMAKLRRRVEVLLRCGDELPNAVEIALGEWREQLVRRQVQQTVWDPSSNQTAQVTGVLRFMPFKHTGPDLLEYMMLMTVFPMLCWQQLGEVARVCKRWRSVAKDPSWMPELVAYAWGPRNVTGISVDCPRPALLQLSITKRILNMCCADAATFAVTESGDVWFWGKHWMSNLGERREPERLEELRDVVSVTASPAGYFHRRNRTAGYQCAAATRSGSLYTWGPNYFDALLHDEQTIERPKKVEFNSPVWNSSEERVLHVALGLSVLTICVQRKGYSLVGRTQRAEGSTSVLSVGSFVLEKGLHTLTEWPELRDVALKSLVAGLFHVCALSTQGVLYTFGDEFGADSSNGNLLGHGDPDHITSADLGFVNGICPPKVVSCPGFGPVAEVSCSSYTTVAILVDGRVFSWGDSDGNALGHERHYCHTPHWLQGLRWQRVSHGALAYTNGAVATDEGRVFVWGGNYWEGGIAAGRGSEAVTEVKWNGVPSCYRCSSVVLASRHGFLLFRKRP